MPADLTPAQRAVWNETVEALETDRVLLRRANGGVLELLARQKPFWLAAVAHVEAHGAVAVVRDDKGCVRFMQQTPEAQLVVKLGANLKGLYETLGLTPASRARLGLESAPEKVSPLAAFLTGGRS
jgi:P27 family predicted phage terminase small subunit